MAYDAYDTYYDPNYYPYSAAQYGNEYDEYGYMYDEYQYNYDPPPPPDKNWVDPVKVNKEYLKNIQEDYIKKDFQGLKNDGIYLLEVLIESFELNNETLENTDKEHNEVKAHVKVMDFPYLEVNGIVTTESPSKSSLEPFYTELFHTIYTDKRGGNFTPPRTHGTSRSSESEDAEESKLDEDETESRASTVETTSATEEAPERTRFEVMQGKCALLSMTGFDMIQSLQRYPVSVKIVRTDKGGEEEEHVTLATAHVRLPEALRKSVLRSISPEADLPSTATHTNAHKLMNEWQEVGEITVTITLTSVGKAVVNCIRGTGDKYMYYHTQSLKALKRVPSITSTGVDPELALDILELGLPVNDSRSSMQILTDCLLDPPENVSLTDLERITTVSGCDWYRLAKQSLPKEGSVHTDLFEDYAQQYASLWLEHKQKCREFVQNDTGNKLQSLYNELEELRDQIGPTLDAPVEKESSGSSHTSQTSESSKTPASSRQTSITSKS